ncbi:MAG: hypothetical protein EB015_06640 [Methylocystaceae bacterium]|nr:hypothetical protein [Methylocystaceae bacterium]
MQNCLGHEFPIPLCLSSILAPHERALETAGQALRSRFLIPAKCARRKAHRRPGATTGLEPRNALMSRGISADFK